MELGTQWNDLPLHEDVTKPQPAARGWPTQEGQRRQSADALPSNPLSTQPIRGNSGTAQQLESQMDEISLRSDDDVDENLNLNTSTGAPARQETPSGLGALGTIATRGMPAPPSEFENASSPMMSAVESDTPVNGGDLIQRDDKDVATPADPTPEEIDQAIKAGTVIDTLPATETDAEYQGSVPTASTKTGGRRKKTRRNKRHSTVGEAALQSP